jgi:heavy metal translocating P-type ATPase
VTGPEVIHHLPRRTRLRLPRQMFQPEWMVGIQQALEALPVTSVAFNADARSLTIKHEPGLQPAEILRLIGGASAEEGPGHPAEPPASHGHMLPLALGGAMAVLAQPVALPLLMVGTMPIFNRAMKGLAQGHVGVDVLDSLALSLTMSGQPITAAAMGLLVEGGEWLRDRTASRSRRAISDLMGTGVDETAWKVVGRRREQVPVKTLESGDVVAVYAGDRIPVDGVVESGVATLDERMLTGESMPVTRVKGEQVYAMTVLHEGSLKIRTSATFEDSRAGRILRFLDDAPIGETRMTDHARRLADRFVLPVMGLGGAVYLLTGSASRAASILIYDLATGIRVAAPTTMLASLTQAARDSILIKGASAVETLARVDAVVFDKTGTLTEGSPEIREVQSYNGMTPDQLLAVAATADEQLRHPLAEALMNSAREKGLELGERDSRTYHIGMGVETEIHGLGRFLVGNRRLMERFGVSMPRKTKKVDRLPGLSRVYIADEKRCIGAVLFRDPPRSEAREVVQALRDRGVKHVVILTGDGPGATETLAADLEVDDWHARSSPEDKARVVSTLKEAGYTVAVVGDGVNDSMALSLADISIAMGEGSDIAQETAQVVLMDPDLRLLPLAIDRARQTKTLMEQNLAIIAAPNAVGLAAAVAGLVNPAVSALVSNGSTVVAAANGLRPLMSRRRADSDMKRRPAGAGDGLLSSTAERAGAPGQRNNTKPREVSDGS